MSKYCLIVSQYRHSYHTFIVKQNEDISNHKYALMKLVEELEKYKRDTEDTRKIHFGDLEYLLDDNKEIFYRYNVNDTGDIYIIHHNSIDRIKEEAIHYELQGYKDSRRYISQKVMEDVSQHHYYETIKQIVKKYFEIA